MENSQLLFFQLAILVPSVILHEVSHGFVANALGDPTAKNAGRLTMNPIPHIDPFGSVILPLFLAFLSAISPTRGIILGWAKPVPINPANLRGRYDELKVSMAGPASNILLALIFGLALRFLPVASIHPTLVLVFAYIVFLNILLAVFNLIPIPPLDGSHILLTLLPKGFEQLKMFLAQYGFILLLFLIFFFFPAILAIVNFIFEMIVGESIISFLLQQ
ncbi:MAG: site-2 protease family protein [Candidatus Wildermuthbacteria bacterium]|nr:site-2 protease family protein [Candidatus Wildermuthbacteria bacterium]